VWIWASRFAHLLRRFRLRRAIRSITRPPPLRATRTRGALRTRLRRGGWFRYYPSRKRPRFARAGIAASRLLYQVCLYQVLDNANNGFNFMFYLRVFYRFCRRKSGFIVETGHALSLRKTQKR
jgi:hypothetical protein